MSSEPESLVLQMLRAMRAEMGDMRAEIRSDMHSLRADMAADLLDLGKAMPDLGKDTGDQIVGLRRAVIEYHTSVIGHGILISELEARGVEQQVDLPAMGAH